MADIIGSDTNLSGSTRQLLAAAAAALIPASSEYGVPGADDPVILAGLIESARPMAAVLEVALSLLDGMAEATHGQSFSSLDMEQCQQVLSGWRTQSPDGMALLVSLVTNAYYTDDRVLASLDMPPRPPFPEGYEIPQGDWSLLDPVKARGPIWREVE